MRGSRLRLRAAIGAALLAAAPALAAQEIPPPVTADTSDLTARFLEADAQARKLTRPVPRPGGDGLLPPGSRLVFSRDSIEWASAGTVGDILQRVPGVYLLRGGWIGSAEVPLVQGRSGAVVEYVVDGIPYLPIGADSTAVDPSLLPLGFIEEIEVERFPGLLRVHLLTRRHDRLAPRTRIAVGTGDLDVSRYQGSLEKRFPSGLGFSGAFDFLSVTSLRVRRENEYQNTNAWLQASWVRGPRSGASLQYFLAGPLRLAGFGRATTTTDTLSRPLDESRRDLHARAWLRQRGDGMGLGLDLVASRTSWQAQDSLERRLGQLGAIASFRAPTGSASLAALRRTDWTTLDLLGRVAAAPTPGLSASFEAGHRRHSGERSSEWVAARAAVALPMGLTLAGTWRTGTVVDYPMIEADTAREVRDRSATLAWQSRMVGAEVGYARTSAPTPAPSWTYPHLGLIGHRGDAEWLTAHLRLAPRHWFTLTGWYSQPLGERAVEGTPPSHALAEAALRSKFLRVFPSGFFELKLAATLESFGTGVLGRDSTGTAATLDGATFVRLQWQMQFGSFTAYLDRQNFLSARAGYVPGIRTLEAANTFGIRWVFWN